MMDTYSFMRQLADSWVLLMMTLFFLGTIVWAFRPGSRKEHNDTANIVFRNETAAGATDQEASK
jgi:cytochrome c oxidase cbb3-type subunit 4